MNLPNQLTVGRLVLCGFFIAAMEMEGGAPYALGLFLLASATDWLDGYLARKWDQITDFGKLLDPLADKILISACFISLVQHDMAPAWIVVLIISREFLITGLRSLAASKGIIMAAEKLGKHKTVSQIITSIIGLILLTQRQWGWDDFALEIHLFVFVPMLWVTLAITIYSGAAYFFKNQSLFAKA